ncbi:MAG TPA: low molecular weight phosphotyrosine protein phosphatase, partial [Oceanospirillales bacterium]|nr:low molecular weight phosphotyrosine protein phosphatase [Oceanospirillales bacterium]
GNICRSPSAQGVFEKLLDAKGLSAQFKVDSAGTHSYHIGHLPDPRSIVAASKRGIDLSRQRARKVESRDFVRFDWIIAMDNDNYHDLLRICPNTVHSKKVHKMMDFTVNRHHTEVPDPYYGGTAGFELVLDILTDACHNLLLKIS